jgi:hypothetical protein
MTSDSQPAPGLPHNARLFLIAKLQVHTELHEIVSFSNRHGKVTDCSKTGKIEHEEKGKKKKFTPSRNLVSSVLCSLQRVRI